MGNVRRKSLAIALAAIALGMSSGAAALEKAIQIANEGCKAELDKYCKDVTPGDERLLRCLEAHEDKVSHRCEYALFKASNRFEEFVMAFKHLARECASDIDSNCPGIPAGDGRIAQCLIDKKDKVSAACKQAMKDTDMEVTPAK